MLRIDDLTRNWEAVLSKYVSDDKSKHTGSELIEVLDNQLRIKTMGHEDSVDMSLGCFRETVNKRIKNTAKSEFDLYSRLKDECKARAEQSWLELHPSYPGRLLNSHKKSEFIAKKTEAIALDELQNYKWLENIGKDKKELAYSILRLGDNSLVKNVPKERIQVDPSFMPTDTMEIIIPVASSSGRSLGYDIIRVRLGYSRPTQTVGDIAHDNWLTVKHLAGYRTVGRIPVREIEGIIYAINGLVTNLGTVGSYNEDKNKEKLTSK